MPGPLFDFECEEEDMLEYKAAELFGSHEQFRITRERTVRDEAPHTHDFIEMVYIFSGTSRQWVDGQQFSVKRGDMMFLGYHQVHAFTVDSPMEYVNILLNPGFLSRQLVHEGNIYEWLTMAVSEDLEAGVGAASPRVTLPVEDMLEAEGIIGHMLEEYQRRALGWQAALRGYLEVMLAKLLRAMSRTQERQLSLSLMPEVLGYIDAHLEEKITLSALAERCFYHPSYFSRLFREKCGMTLTEYVTKRRMEEAARLLEQTTMNVDQVAAQVGYSERKAFYTAFRQWAGMPPGAWRSSRGKR